MKRYWVSTIIAGLLITTGCNSNPSLLKTKGRVKKGAAAFIPKNEDADVQVVLVPITADGSKPRSYFATVVDQETGQFYASGGRMEGVPPGKYRAIVALVQDRKDTLKGKFDESHSPFVFEISKNSPEIVIDLDTAPL